MPSEATPRKTATPRKRQADALQRGKADLAPRPKLRRHEAIEIIRRRILAGDPGFKSGEFLTEKFIHEQLKLSRAPIRQALSQLAAEGLVTVIPRIGTQVRIVRPEEAQAIMSLRLGIETIIVRELARTKPNLSPLQAIHAHMGEISKRSPLDENDIIEFVSYDMNFHAKMAELADGYSAAISIMKDLTSQFLLYACRIYTNPSTSLEFMNIVIGDHGEIIKKLSSGKPPDAIGAYAATS